MTGPERSPSRFDSRRARQGVAKYLLEGEEAIIATRRHWAVLVGPAVTTVPVLAVGVWLLLLAPDNRIPSSAGLVLVLGGLSWFGLRVAEWWMRHFIVSPRRMLLTSGIVVRTVTLLPRRRITDLTWQKTLFGQLLGYGTFRIESAGQHQALAEVTFLPRADLLYRQLSELLFPDGDGEAEEVDKAARRRCPPGATGQGGRRDTEPIPRLPRGVRDPSGRAR